MKTFVKKLLFGNKPTQIIKAGVAKGLKMNIDISGKAQRILGLDEREIQSFFEKYAKKCSHFFDIGASDGYYSLIYRKYNKKGVIHMFEAQERFKQEQEDHFKMNNFELNYKYYSKFVSNKNDEKNLSIDDIFKEKNAAILFKIDVDGGEMDVLKGMTNTLSNNKCFFIIETHTKQLEIDCIEFVQKHGYKAKIIDAAWYRTFIPEERPIEHNRWFVAEKD